MRISRFLVAAAAPLVLGCAEGGDRHDITAPTRAAAARQVETQGAFEAQVDFSTLRLTPRGRNCLLVVDGRLVFSGTIVGVATGTTSALVFASCQDVATTPPGTYADDFHSELTFEGTVDGVPARADGMYVGRSAPGGHIAARLVFDAGMAGSLDVDAQLAVGGTYAGRVVVR